METEKLSGKLRGLSLAALVFGALGGVFFWWVPLGMVLSLTGLLLSFFDWTNARKRSLDSRLSIVGLLISAATLALDIVIAWFGLQTLTFGGR